MEGQTRITMVDDDNDCYELRVASDQAIIRNHDPLVGVALSEGLHELFEDTPVAAMYGWQVVVTDGNTGVTYSGTISDVSPYGFLLET